MSVPKINPEETGMGSMFPRVYYSTYDKPKFYSFIPESFKLNWEDPHEFLPIKMQPQFNEKMFYNFVHRECFNSCVTNGSSLSQLEKNCYDNCNQKHLYSMGIFKDALMQRRKWRGWKNFVSIQEYSRTPEEIASHFPTDPILRNNLLEYEEMQFKKSYPISGFNDLFRSDVSDKRTITVFDVYLKQRYLEGSAKEEEIQSKQRKDVYNEYKELNSQYGPKIAEMLKKKNIEKKLNDLPGENFSPEEDAE